MDALAPSVVPYEGVKLAPPLSRVRLIGYELRSSPPSEGACPPLPFYTLHLTPSPSSVPAGTLTPPAPPPTGAPHHHAQSAALQERTRLSFHRKPYTVYRRYTDFAEFSRRMDASLRGRRPQVLLALPPLAADPLAPHLEEIDLLLERVTSLPKALLEVREVAEFFGIWKSDVDYKLARNLSDPLALTFASRTLAHEHGPGSPEASGSGSGSGVGSTRAKPFLKRTKSTQGLWRHAHEAEQRPPPSPREGEVGEIIYQVDGGGKEPSGTEQLLHRARSILLRPRASPSHSPSHSQSHEDIDIESTAKAFAQTTAAIEAKRVLTQGLTLDNLAPGIGTGTGTGTGTTTAYSPPETPGERGLFSPQHQPPSPQTPGRLDSTESVKMARGAQAFPGLHAPPASHSQGQRTLRRKPALPGVVGGGGSGSGSGSGDAPLLPSAAPHTPMVTSPSSGPEQGQGQGQPPSPSTVRGGGLVGRSASSNGAPRTPLSGVTPGLSASLGGRSGKVPPSLSPSHQGMVRYMQPDTGYSASPSLSPSSDHIPPWSPLHPKHLPTTAASSPSASYFPPQPVSPWNANLERKVSAHRQSPSLSRNHTITDGRPSPSTLRPRADTGPRPGTSGGIVHVPSAHLHPAHRRAPSHGAVPTSPHRTALTPPHPMLRTMASAGSLAVAAAAAEAGTPLPEEERAEARVAAPSSLLQAAATLRRMAADHAHDPLPPLLLDEAGERKAQALIALDPSDKEPRRLLRANSLARLRHHMAARANDAASPVPGTAAPAQEDPAISSVGVSRSLSTSLSPHAHLQPQGTTLMPGGGEEVGRPSGSLHRSRSSPSIPDSILLRRTQAISPLLPASALQRARSISRSGGSIRRSPSQRYLASPSAETGGTTSPSSLVDTGTGLLDPALDIGLALGVPAPALNEYEEAEAHLVDLKIVVDKRTLIKLQVDREIRLPALWAQAEDKFRKCGSDHAMDGKVLVYRDEAGNVVRMDGEFALGIVLAACPRKMTFFCV